MNCKTAFITGSAKRIGATIAKDLHTHGMNVVIHYHTSEHEAVQLKNTLNSIRSKSAFIVNGDLSQTNSYEALVSKILGFTNRLDILINNASLFYPTPMDETTHMQWSEIIRVNMMAPYFLGQSCRQHLENNNGCIINITDIYGNHPLRNYPVYSASKAGLIMLTKAMALEMGPKIRVNAISPGAILWPEEHDQHQKNEVLLRTILQRKGLPKDVASTVRYLIEGAEYTTGQVINVDGGRFL